jgi:hypothetical protein
VQTFLPFESFAETAAVLDQRRLGKQRVEVLQILRALTRDGYGWRSHPAVLMWKGHEEALGAYGRAIVDAWTALGFSGGRRPEGYSGSISASASACSRVTINECLCFAWSCAFSTISSSVTPVTAVPQSQWITHVMLPPSCLIGSCRSAPQRRPLGL